VEDLPQQSSAVALLELHLIPYPRQFASTPLVLAMASYQQLPSEPGLFIATPDAIHLRSQLAERPLFKCETADGIVNARASKDNRSLFAVADGQVVILHDATQGKDKKYKLKNGDVCHVN
jgi:hypothetical protein